MTPAGHVAYVCIFSVQDTLSVGQYIGRFYDIATLSCTVSHLLKWDVHLSIHPLIHPAIPLSIHLYVCPLICTNNVVHHHVPVHLRWWCRLCLGHVNTWLHPHFHWWWLCFWHLPLCLQQQPTLCVRVTEQTPVSFKLCPQYFLRSDSGVVNIYDRSCLSETTPRPIKAVMNLTTTIQRAQFNETGLVYYY